ncbi:hypothetical protein B9Z19DRAFT_1072262 [Tuber borchii]|uniref:Uncharacterized protein n=1 Tax=Tuber borchii TaxID=42251 RepID=A0A2T7A727_TUBBO|nr:hypothetical protein B9Z19DRAFT_1072262 [Tuber borchii]
MLEGYCRRPERVIGCLGNGFYSNGAMLISNALLPQLIYTSWHAGSWKLYLLNYHSLLSFSYTIFINHVAVPDNRLPILTIRDSGVWL